MNNDTFNRKEFLKRFGLGLGAAMLAPQIPALANFNSDTKINNTQKTFLREYAGWLKEFNVFVHKRNIDPNNTANNKRLMELSAEAEKRKPLLEENMKNPDFAHYFNEITQGITQNIES